MKCPKYEYHVQTWGGFYNKEHAKKHKLKEGDFFFDTKEARNSFIENRRRIEKELDAHVLMIDTTEGFCSRIKTVLHRVIEVDGVQYYSQREMGFNYPFGAAKYHMEWKWYPGFNDYPLGEGFDYSGVKIVQAWITGAWQ